MCRKIFADFFCGTFWKFLENQEFSRKSFEILKISENFREILDFQEISKNFHTKNRKYSFDTYIFLIFKKIDMIFSVKI